MADSCVARYSKGSRGATQSRLCVQGIEAARAPILYDRPAITTNCLAVLLDASIVFSMVLHGMPARAVGHEKCYRHSLPMYAKWVCNSSDHGQANRQQHVVLANTTARWRAPATRRLQPPARP